MPAPTHAQRLAAREMPAQRLWMHHTWRDLLFVHWRCEPGVIQQTLPPDLTVDTFDGAAWVGIVPFRMCDIRPIGCPPLPLVSNFLELNVRTYAYDRTGRPGVWFYSLDANSWPAVLGARATYHLPYHWARMSFARDAASGRIRYGSHRRHSAADVATHFEYTHHGPTRAAHDPASLDFFLIERYDLFAVRNNVLYSGRVHHAPYEKSAAQLMCWDMHMLDLNRLPIPTRPPDHVAYSPGVTVQVFGLHPVG
ncbi:MAG: DUF2071 domain-containing protein [Planctomycetaceae bacterium]